GTPLTASRPIEAATENREPRIQSQRGNIAPPSPQNAQASRNTPAISRSPRSEQRSLGTGQSAPIVVRPPQTEAAPRPLAEILPRTIEPGVPNGGERLPGYQPPRNFSPPPVAAPRAIEAPAFHPSSPPRSYSPPPAVSRPQPAASPSPSPSRNEGGRRP